MSQYTEDEYLAISGLQHFTFCRRQWALIHIEQQWEENLRTVEGELLHERAHDANLSEKRGDCLTVRALRVHSATLGAAGMCDAVEFTRDERGVALTGREGKWLLYPVEYKRGVSKDIDADRLQLCCQAMCLEEMLSAEIREGALYYGETRRREPVSFTQALRETVRDALCEMHALQARGYTPKVKTGAMCRACSLKEICIPKLCRNLSASGYMKGQLEVL